MKAKKQYVLFILYISIILFITLPKIDFSADPKLISTLNNAFEKLESYLVKLSTPAAAVAVGSGVFMKKFSFGDEEKIRMAKRIIRGSLFSYGFILCVDLVLALMKTLLS